MADRPAHEDALQRLHVRIARLPILAAVSMVFVIASGELNALQVLAALTVIASGVCGVASTWPAGTGACPTDFSSRPWSSSPPA